jgi:chromosome partitioning protein
MPGVVAVLGKGGGGKTTTAATLGAVVAAMGERVVLVDFDSTPTLTAWLAPDLDDDAASAADVLAGQAALEDALLPVRERLDLLLGAVDVAAYESTVKASAVRSLVEAVRARADVALLDLRGGVASQLSAAAAAAADLLLVPVEAAPAGVRSLKLSRRLAEELDRTIGGVLPTRYNPRALVAANWSRRWTRPGSRSGHRSAETSPPRRHPARANSSTPTHPGHGPLPTTAWPPNACCRLSRRHE